MKLLTTLSKRRRHPLAPLLLLLVGLGVTGGVYTAVAPTRPANAASSVSTQTLEEGRALYLRNCSSCHGLNAEGSSDGPSLIGVGAAAVDFQVSTGRMPAAQTNTAQIPRKPAQFTPEEIRALAAYIASLAPGPQIPSAEQLDLRGANAANGGDLYRTNCAMCHNFAGSGGALTRGKYAPSLTGVEPRFIYEAMITGPQSMPVFSDHTITPQEKKDIIAYLKTTASEPSPGGFSLGKLGPVSEGLVGWVVGIGALIACTIWLGAKAR